jgi:enoyl-CoA hydratase
MPIHYEKADHVVTITMDRPEKRNAMDLEHGHALAAGWKRFNEDPDARVAIITGVETSFCAGGDLTALNAIAVAGRESGATDTYRTVQGVDGIRWTLKNYEIAKPIIAAVNGFCVAGGFEMLGATDIRIASTEAVFAVPEPQRGLVAMGGTCARLTRQLPWPLAMEILLTGDRFDAFRALEIGLVNRVVEPAGFRTDLARAYEIEEAIGAQNFITEDAAEGSAAFVQKREPVWRGR